MNSASSEDFDAQKNQLFNDILLWISISTSLGVALSVLRIVVIGWKPLMGIHIMVLVSLWSLWLGRRLFSYRVRVLGLLALIWIVSTGGLVQLGPLGLGGILVVVFSFIAILFLDGYLAWWLIVGNILSLIMIGIMASRHWLEFDLDYRIYAYHPITWTHTIWTFSAYAIIFALFGWRLMNWLLDRERVIRQERDLKQYYLDTAQSIMVSLDQTGRITMVNRKGCELLGREESELFGRNWFECALPQPLGMETLLPRFLAVMSGAESTANTKLEYPMACRDGAERLIAWENACICDSQNRLIGMLSSGIDITEREQGEIALRESEDKFRLAFNNANTGMCLVDMHGKLMQVNDKMSAIFGYSKHELEGMTVNDLALPEYRRLSPAFIRQAVQGNKDSDTFEKHYRHRLGHIIYGQVSTSLVRDVQGQARYFISQVQDITDRKKVEEALKNSEERLRLITDIAPVFLAEIDKELCYRFVNRRYAEMFGMSPEALCGQHVRKIISEQAFAHAKPYMLKALAGQLVEFEVEFPPPLPGGHKVMAARYAPRHDVSGQIIGFVAAIIDITERKRAEEEIKQLAFYDTLTQLPNRRLLLDRLQQAVADCVPSKLHGALLFIDLDNFKALNDTQGHDKGDLLLQEVASRLLACVRECDTVARLGGDEFVVVLVGLDARPEEALFQVQNIGMKILDRLSQKYHLAGHEHYCSASVGITLFGRHSNSPKNLMKQADIALYQAKNAGRNALRVFSPEAVVSN